MVVAVGLGTTVATVDLAARTDRAYPTYLDDAGVADLVVNPSVSNERAAEVIAAAPGVRAVRSADMLTATLDAGEPRTQSAVDSSFTQVHLPSGGRFVDGDRPAVLDGRMVRSGREAFLSVETAESIGVEVGDDLPLAFWAPSYNTPGIGPGQDDLVQPLGRELARVVGVGLFADEMLGEVLYPRQRVVVTPEVAEAYTCTIGGFDELEGLDLDDMFERLVPAGCALSYRYFTLDAEPGADVDAIVAWLSDRFQRENEGIPELLREQDVGYTAIPSFRAEEERRVQEALEPAVTALQLFAAAAGAATLVLAVLAGLRCVRRFEQDSLVWRQLGVTRRQRWAALGLPVLAAVLAGTAGAVAIACGATVLDAVGSAAPLDRFAWSAWAGNGAGAVLVVGAVTILGATVLLSVAALEATGRSHARPPMLAGLLSALDPTRRQGVVAATRGAGATAVLIGAALTVTVVAGSLVFSANLGSLLSDPARYGWPYDEAVMIGFGYGGADEDAIASALDRPEIEAFGVAALGTLAVDGNPIAGVAARVGFEDLAPPVTSGRLPVRDDEIAMGRQTLRDLGVSVGDEVLLSSDFGERPATVTGTVVLPAVGPFESHRATSGAGAYLPAAFFEALIHQGEAAAGLDPGSLLDLFGSFVVIDVADGVDEVALMTSLGDRLSWDRNGFESIAYPTAVRPPLLDELDAMRRVPTLLGLVFASTMALGLGLSVAMATRRRRQELTVLRALGCRRRDLRRTIRWHGLTVTTLGLVVGLPLGVALGRSATRPFITELGVVESLVVPWGSLALLALAATAMGVAVGLIPSPVGRAHPQPDARAPSPVRMGR
jgi:hypothetical protein